MIGASGNDKLHCFYLYPFLFKSTPKGLIEKLLPERRRFFRRSRNRSSCKELLSLKGPGLRQAMRSKPRILYQSQQIYHARPETWILSCVKARSNRRSQVDSYRKLIQSSSFICEDKGGCLRRDVFVFAFFQFHRL